MIDIVGLKLKKLKHILSKNLRNMFNMFEKLTQFKFLKFKEIFQNLFYLLRFEKHEINLEGTNIFDWRKAKSKYFFF